MSVPAVEAGTHANGWTGMLAKGSISVTSSPAGRPSSQTPQRRWSDGAASSRHLPLSDASITAAAAELAAARAAGLQARTLRQTPLPASTASAASVQSPQPQAEEGSAMLHSHDASVSAPVPRPGLSVAARGEQADLTASAGMPGKKRAAPQCAESEQLRALPLDAYALDEGNSLRSPELQQQPGSVRSSTLPGMSIASQPGIAADAAMAADLPMVYVARPPLPYGQHERDQPLLGRPHAAHPNSRSCNGAGLPDPASASKQGPPTVSVGAEQLPSSDAAEDPAASLFANGWHPRSSVSRAPSDLGGEPSDAIPLRVRFGGSRSGTPTPYPSDDGAPSIGAHSTAVSGGDEDGRSTSHATLLASCAAERDRVPEDETRPQQLDAATATAGDGLTADAGSGWVPVDVTMVTRAGLVPHTSADSVAPEQWATYADAAATTSPQQLDRQQLGRPIMRWAQHAAPTATADEAPAQAQESQHGTASRSQAVQEPASCHGQRDDDIGPAAVDDPVSPALVSLQHPATIASFHTQPASLRSTDPQPPGSSTMQEPGESVVQRDASTETAQQADGSTSAAVITRDVAATPQRGLLARLPFAGVLRARRWRRRSDGHTVDETILGARPPSHDGGAISAGICTPPRTPRRCVLMPIT